MLLLKTHRHQSGTRTILKKRFSPEAETRWSRQVTKPLPEATRGRQRHASIRPTCSSQDTGQLAVWVESEGQAARCSTPWLHRGQ